MVRFITCGLLIFYAFFYANAQQENIDTIYISSTSLRTDHIGGQRTKLPSQEQLSSTLEQNTSIFIKNYGPGSLATSSIRGGSAGHTLVLWNGLPIQNPFLGLLDLSLLETWSMSEVDLQKGGNSAMWGSGAIGGVINLKQINEDKERLIITNSLALGSFGRVEEKAKISIRGSAKLRSVTSYSFLKANNQYPYTLSNGDIRFQTNAHQRQVNFYQDLYFTPNKKNEITAHYWRTRAERQNPPTTVQRSSEAYQEDDSDRFSVHWKHFSKNTITRSKTAYYFEDLNYYDPLQRITSETHFETFLADIDHEIKIKNFHKVNFGLSHFRTRVISPANYAEVAIENKSAAFVSYRYKWFQVSGRQEVVNGNRIPFVPSAGFQMWLLPKLQMKAKASRNYRLPTLNDRFWVPGGNIDLKPESGWSEEVSLSYQELGEKWNFKVNATAFNRVISDWIQWTQDGPLNINRVWSRGTEWEANIGYNTGEWTITNELGYDYIRSTNEKALTFPKINIGDQLFYTPVHQSFASTKVSYKNFILHYRHRFTGGMSGLNDDLEAYSVGNLKATWIIRSLKVTGSIYNIWNEQYRVIERRPMPGRNYQIVANYTFKKE